MADLSQNKRHLLAAEGYLELEMPDHALRELTSVEVKPLSRFRYHQLKGEALRQLKQHEEALEELEQACSEKPDDLGVLMGMAWCYKRIDRLADAIQMMQRAYEVAPENGLVLYNMACYFSLDGDKMRTLEWLGRALRKEQALRKLIPKETDFDPFRDDPDFQLLLGYQDS